MDEHAENRRRLVEATVALLQSAPGQRMQITNLNKGLFYMDLVALRDTGSTVTHGRYLAMNQGPVLDGYKDNLILELTRAGLARQDEDGMAQPIVLTVAPEEFHYHYLDDALRSIAARVAPKIAAESATGVSDLSHKNPAWDIAHRQGMKRGLPPVAINMFMAMQQVAASDPWLDEPLDDAMASVFAMADIAAGEPW